MYRLDKTYYIVILEEEEHPNPVNPIFQDAEIRVFKTKKDFEAWLEADALLYIEFKKRYGE